MAKGSTRGIVSGRLGNEVLYRNSNSNNSEQQARRVYVPKIANPKTAAQCAQRVKLAPAVNFYRAFKEEVLNHSFQGVKYGGRSQSEFMKLAMLMTEGFPYIVKGSTELIPGAYRVSRGSLPGISVTDITLSGVKISITAPTVTEGMTYDAFVTALLAANPTLQKGDQITLMTVIKEDLMYFPLVERLILDESKYTGTTVNEVFAEVHMAWTEDTLMFNAAVLQDVEIVGAAVIVSRPVYSQTSGSLSWLRSNATMFVSDSVTDVYMTTDAQNAAELSYSSQAKSPNSKFYLNQGTTGF